MRFLWQFEDALVAAHSELRGVVLRMFAVGKTYDLNKKL